MKTHIAILIALLCALFGCAAAEGLPEVGDSIDGFTVTDVSHFDMIDADLVRLRHDKTGAEVLYIANDDTNRVFNMVFRTPALDDTGLPHVFEHATLDGSEKYPSSTLFFELSNQTYNTYMNAATYNFMTSYPVASLSEEQLLALADYYTDSCLHPTIMTDPSAFDEEAWRYVLTDADGDMTLEGTVYSEMLGAYTLDSAANNNLMKTLMPGSRFSNVAGGIPSEIPNLTYERLVEYHDTYYHPSNSLTVLYGSFEDYTAFLKLLDGYFSEYDAADITVGDDGYEPIEKAQKETFEYAAEEGTSAENAAVISYAFVCPDLTEEETFALSGLAGLMEDTTLPMARRMEQDFPAATFSVTSSVFAAEPYIEFTLTGANESDAKAFRTAVDEEIARFLTDGFDADALEAAAASYDMSVLLATDTGDLGVSMSSAFAAYWAINGDPLTYVRSIDYIGNIDDDAENGTYAALIEKYLTDNPRTALVTTVPKPGLKEKEAETLQKSLNKTKKAMSDEEIDALIGDSVRADVGEETDDSEMLAALNVVSVGNLPDEIRVYETNDTTGDDIRRITVYADMEGIGTGSLLLDASQMDETQLVTLKLICDLTGDVDTSAHTHEELQSLTERWLYDPTIKVSLVRTEDSFHPYVRLTFTSLTDGFDEGYELMYELLFETDFASDPARLKDLVAGLVNDYKQQIQDYPYSIILFRAEGITDGLEAAYNSMNCVEYYEFLLDIQARLESDPQSVVSELEAVQTLLKNSYGAVGIYAGAKDSESANREASDAFLAKLDSTPVESREWNFTRASDNEALCVASNVNYNLIYADMDTLGTEYDEGAMTVAAQIVYDKILLPKLRDAYGVYGVLHGVSEQGMYIVSYRDPNIAETNAVYDALGESVQALRDIDQETLDAYILPVYSLYAQSAGELSGAQSTALSLLEGHTQQETLDTMRSIKGMTPERMNELLGMYETLAEKGVRMTAGGRTAIAEAEFDVVLDPFHTDEMALSEGEYGEAAQFLTEYGLMKAQSDEEYGVNESITRGEFAGILCRLVGEDLDGEKAMEFWNENGFFGGEEDDTLTREELALIGGTLWEAFGMSTDTDYSLSDYEDAKDISKSSKDMFAFMVEKGWLLPREDGTLAPKADATRGEVALVVMRIMCDEKS